MSRTTLDDWGATRVARRRPRRVLVSASIVLAMTAALGATPGSAQDEPAVPDAAVTGPILATPPEGPQMGSYPWLATEIDLAAQGYVEEEFFLEGSARSFADDGTPDGEAAYKTRILVRRPVAAEDWNGVVVLEWNNVTGGNDLEIDWFNSHEYFTRSGIAWVGVTAQRVGVAALPRFNLSRYGTLSHPDDEYSYDIYSQAAKAVRAPAGVDPLGGIGAPQLVVATGHSQSSGRLGDYYDIVQASHRLVDGFILHGSGGAPNLEVGPKVMTVWSETEVGSTIPEDADNYRHWETAGSSHVSLKVAREYEPLVVRDRGFLTPKQCTEPPHSLIPDAYVLNAAYDHMIRWLQGGEPPPAAPRIERDGSAVATDEDGNALGGIRLPQHAVPTAQNDGENVGAVFCILYGSHDAWTSDELLERYPTRADYVCPARRATEEAVRAGFLLVEDAQEYLGSAEGANFGWQGDAAAAPTCAAADLGGEPPPPAAVRPCLDAPVGDEVRRLGGTGPVGIAVAVSAQCFETADAAIVARADDHADALAAGALAAELDAPVLLTPTGALDTAVAGELLRLAARRVILVGGEAALAPAVAQDLERRGHAVERLSGTTRFETAGAIAQEIAANGGPVSHALVALGSRPQGGDAWPDAISAGVLAAAARAPVLLALPDAAPPATLDALAALLPDRGDVTLVGGTAALSEEVENQLAAEGYTVDRASGPTRYGTSAAVVERAVAAGGGLQPLLLASGEDPAGPLAAAAAAAHRGGAMLLVAPQDLSASPESEAFLRSQADAIDLALVVGDASGVADAVAEQARAAVSDS